MDLRPIDRRGLGEVVAWSSVLLLVALLIVADLFKTGKLDDRLIGLLGGVVAALMGRGAQSAAERSAREDIARQLENSAKAYALKAKEAADRAEEAATSTEQATEKGRHGFNK
jgi:voltage-gated potassium channel Kch